MVKFNSMLCLLPFTVAQIGTPIGQVSGTDPDSDAVLVYTFTEPKTAQSSSGFDVDINVYDFKVFSTHYSLPNNKMLAWSKKQ